MEYVDCCFEHVNATYRYMPRSKIMHLLERVYEQDEAVLEDDSAMSLLLSVMGTGQVTHCYSRRLLANPAGKSCMWLASWKSLDFSVCSSKSWVLVLSKLFYTGF